MALRAFKPTTPTRRHTVLLASSDLKRVVPEKSLLRAVKYHAGRNFRGVITVRSQGGQVKRMYRVVDFLRDKHNIPGIVKTVEYDPNRSANIALIQYKDGEKRYILAPDQLKIGEEVMSGENAAIKVGNALPLKKIPVAMFVHNVELNPGRGGVLGRSAGAVIQIQGGDKGYVQLKMPSGEIRLVSENCYATVGIVGNLDVKNIKIGKAGRKRYMGIKPTVRGVATSGGTHPHGDGQGKSGRHGPGGPAKDPWGNRVGTRTRRNKVTNKYIVKHRVNKKGRQRKTHKTII
jgi:large subunit ribosomal protein L2